MALSLDLSPARLLALPPAGLRDLAAARVAQTRFDRVLRPIDQAFYQPPADLVAGQPGELILVAEYPARLTPRVKLPGRAWRILYRSTTATGDPTVVSGTVLVPPTPWRGPGARPIVGHAIGTQGMGDRCAPSRQLEQGIEYEAAVILMALRRGWAVALTDYPGLGTPGDHTYVVGQSNGRAVLDSIRAARRLPEANLDDKGPVAIFGYSEGGGAAGWAIQLQPEYAPDVEIAAAAVGSAPRDFPSVLNFHDGGPFFFLILYTALGFTAAYPELDLTPFLNDRGHEAAARLADTFVQEAITLGLLMPMTQSAYFISNPFDEPDWRRRMLENGLGDTSPQTPVILGAGRRDQAIPFDQTRGLYERWRARGVDAHFRTLSYTEHIAGGVWFAPVAHRFLAQHLSG